MQVTLKKHLNFFQQQFVGKWIKPFIYLHNLVNNFCFLFSQKFDVQLPSLTLTLNDKQILVLYNFLFHFPSPSLVPPKLETTRDAGEPTPHRMVNDFFSHERSTLIF